MSNTPSDNKPSNATAGNMRVDREEVRPPAGKKKARKKYSPRSSLGFHLLVVSDGNNGDAQSYTESGAPTQKSLGEAMRYIKEHAQEFDGKRIMVAHLKKEVSVAVVTKVVAEIK